MKRIFIVFLVLILSLTACDNKGTVEEMEADQQEKYIKMSEENIIIINEGGFEALDEKYSEEMREAMTKDTVKKSEEAVEKMGNFQEFGEGAAIYNIDEKNSNKFIVSQIEAIYENGKLIYTINYDLDDNIIGLFMK